MDWMISSDHPSANIPLAILLAVGALGPLPLYPLESGCHLATVPSGDSLLHAHTAVCSDKSRAI